MPKYLTQKEAFHKCQQEGKFFVLEGIDLEKIKSTLLIAEGDVKSADLLIKQPKESNQ